MEVTSLFMFLVIGAGKLDILEDHRLRVTLTTFLNESEL